MSDLRAELDEPVAFQIASPGWRALAKDRPGVWSCNCGVGWFGTAASYPNDLRAHALFRADGGERGAAHDPGLARFRPDQHPKAAPPSLDGLDVERLARAIALACANHNEECWFRANPERGADAILAALRDEGETT